MAFPGEDGAATSSYELFGLSLLSEIPLPDLFPAAAVGKPDVVIRRGSIPAASPEEPQGLSVRPDGAVLNIAEAGRYWIREGREIVVEAGPDASDRNVRLFLLGSAFGAILHQRGLLPLHANAIEIDGRAVAFMGHSGAGKSTMAAWFHDRGFRILADDVCVVTTGEGGQPLAHGGIPRLRLWREALEASGRTADEFDLSFDDMDKYDVPTRAGASRQPLELDHIYLLTKAEGNGRITQLTGIEAVDALVANTYRGGYLELMGGAKAHLLQCLHLVKTVPVFRAERLWGYDAFEEQARMLEDHARAVMARKAEPDGGL